MTFAELVTELQARGFSDLSATRAGYFVNQGRHELDTLYTWPYRVTTATGGAGVGTCVITDLGVIEEVINTADNSRVLEAADRRDLRRVYGALTTTGTPEYFYVDNTTVRAYPVGGTLEVRYFKRCPNLSGVQTPLSPEQYHLLIVDLAVRWAYKDSDDTGMAQFLSADIDRQLAVMADDLLGGQQIVTPDYVVIRSGSSDD